MQACVTLQIEPMVEMIIHVSTRDSTNGAAVGKVVRLIHLQLCLELCYVFF